SDHPSHTYPSFLSLHDALPIYFVCLVESLGKPHTLAISPSNGSTWYFSASDQNSAVSSRTLSAYLSATSSACEKSSSRLYNSHLDRKSTRLNSSHVASSYAVFW